MQISPFENGAHSLAEGLKYLDEYLADTAKQYSLKSAIINIHHGIETLLKDSLFQRNPVFVLSEKATIKQAITRYKEFFEKKNDYIFDDEYTITPTEALSRTRTLQIGVMKERDYQALAAAFERLNNLRNQLQHFALRADPQFIIKIFGDLIPKAVRYIASCYTFSDRGGRVQVLPHYSLAGMEHLFQGAESLLPYLQKFYPGAGKLIDVLQSKYDVLLNEAIVHFKGQTFAAIKQSLEIDSFGQVGAPPYHATLRMAGWINEEFVSHRNAVEVFDSWRAEDSSASYTGLVKLNEPIVKESTNNSLFQTSIIEQGASASFEINAKNITKLISLEQCSEYIEFLRDARIIVSVTLSFQGQVFDFETNYHMSKEEILSGEVVIHFTSGIFGDHEEKQKIDMVQRFPLNTKNTIITFGAFGNTEQFLNHRHTLLLKITENADITTT